MDQTKLPTGIYSLIWFFLKKYKGHLSIFLLAALIWSLEISASPYLLKMMLDRLLKTANQPEILVATIMLPAILYTSMGLILNLSFRLYGHICIKLYPMLREEIIAKVYAHLSGHSYDFFQENFSGNLASKLKDLSGGVEQIVKIPMEFFIPRGIAVIIASLALTFVSPALSIVLFIWSVLFVLTTGLFYQRIRPYSIQLAESQSQLGGETTDVISNQITTKIFANERYEYQRVQSNLKKVTAADKTMQRKMQLAFFVQGLFAPVLITLLIVILVDQRLNNAITVGDFAFVLSLAVMIMVQIWDIGKQIILYIKTVSECQQALNVLLQPHENRDQKNAHDMAISKGKIEFKDVCFSHRQGGTLFNKLNITIEPKQKVGLVGYSGGGKSSFIKLILRLFEVESGTILIDGQTISNTTKHSLRRNISLIPQDPQIFHRTLYDNIRYGNMNANYEEVIAAAKKAHCDEFISCIEHGYDTIAGERGVKLSGGQQQRIAIARAILKDADILILDEATSALDSITEREIQNSLHNMMQDKTTIVIAHRLSTLHEMDRILFFKNGEIIEDGTLEELHSGNGPFAKMWSMQSDGYLPEHSEDND